MIKALLGQKKATEDLAAKLNTVPTYKIYSLSPSFSSDSPELMQMVTSAIGDANGNSITFTVK